MVRSIAAVLAGFVFIATLSFGADSLLRSLVPSAFGLSGRVESPAVLLLILAYVGVFAVTGCYLAARLAPHHPMRHALVLGALGLVFNVAGTFALWNTRRIQGGVARTAQPRTAHHAGEDRVRPGQD